MKFPRLVRKSHCKTPIEVTLYGEDISEDGAPIIVRQYRVVYPSDSVFPSDGLIGENLFCNWQDSAKTILTKEQKKVKISGMALFNGDIAPELPVISGGYIVINGVQREIAKGVKARNPDGTVNYTELDVM